MIEQDRSVAAAKDSVTERSSRYAIKVIEQRYLRGTLSTWLINDMARVHTHYDNLKVARHASTEMIRAAYKKLLQKYHPDRNPGDSEALAL